MAEDDFASQLRVSSDRFARLLQKFQDKEAERKLQGFLRKLLKESNSKPTTHQAIRRELPNAHGHHSTPRRRSCL